jgi:hypothetical protein
MQQDRAQLSRPEGTVLQGSVRPVVSRRDGLPFFDNRAMYKPPQRNIISREKRIRGVTWETSEMES